MPKAGDLNWEHLYKTGQVEQQEHPLSKPISSKKGSDIVSDLSCLIKSIKEDSPKQPTDEQLFGHLVVTEEELEKRQKKWENTILNWFKEVNEPIEKINKNDWQPSGESFLKSLSEEELKKYLQEEKRFNKI